VNIDCIHRYVCGLQENKTCTKGGCVNFIDESQEVSDVQIEFIICRAEMALRHNKVPKKYRANALLTLKTYITNPSLRTDVCHKCLGTGKRIK